MNLHLKQRTLERLRMGRMRTTMSGTGYRNYGDGYNGPHAAQGFVVYQPPPDEPPPDEPNPNVVAPNFPENHFEDEGFNRFIRIFLIGGIAVLFGGSLLYAALHSYQITQWIGSRLRHEPKLEAPGSLRPAPVKKGGLVEKVSSKGR